MAATIDARSIVLASEVTAGAFITEVETPEGPFYKVAKVNAKSLVVYLDADYPEDGTTRLSIRATDQVRVASEAA